MDLEQIESLPKDQVFKEVVKTLIVYAKNFYSKRAGNVHYVSGTKFIFEDKSIKISDKKKNLYFTVVCSGEDIELLEPENLLNNDKRLKKLLNSKRWQTAINNIAKILEDDEENRR